MAELQRRTANDGMVSVVVSREDAEWCVCLAGQFCHRHVERSCLFAKHIAEMIR
jgi:hypothetical protein